jgi:hypothetical protein
MPRRNRKLIKTSPQNQLPAPPQVTSANSRSLAAENLKYLLVGLVAAGLWTAVGGSIAYFTTDLQEFVAEWRSLQAFPSLALATWLLLLSHSALFQERISRLVKESSDKPSGFTSKRSRWAVVVAFSCLGPCTLIGMGFNAHGPILIFYWATAIISGFMAGLVMVHTMHVIMVIHQLRAANVKMFSYSPARTPELREVVGYFATFSLILSIAYLFAFLGTINGRWIGNPQFIHGVQLFWPIVYVPVCTTALLYPHIAVHRLIKTQKERVVFSYHREIDSLLGEYQNLNNEAVQRVNTISQFLERMNSTPDYVVDFGLAIKTVMPLVFNLVILFAKSLMGQV